MLNVRAFGVILILCAGVATASEDAFNLKTPPKDARPMALDVFNFDRDALGKPPAHFALAVAGEEPETQWQVKRDLQAVSPPNVLAQTGKGEPGDYVSMMLLEGRPLEHGEVAVQFRVMTTEGDQSAGLVWRYQDPKNFYEVVASAQDESCSVYRVKKGKRKLLDQQAAVITPYTWHELRVVFVKDNYSVFVNKELTVGGKDSGLQGAGLAGLCAQGDTAAQFDDFDVSKTTAPAQ